MWLLTQDKDCLVNLSNYDTVYAAGNMVVASKLGEEEGVALGRYYHDEDAQQVIEDLAKFIEDSSSLPFAEDGVVYIVK